MNNTNYHPILTVPPKAHALHKWNEMKREVVYEYNGRHIITLKVPGAEEVGFRHGSDGNIQNSPFIQQLYFMVDEPVMCECRFLLSHEALNMRPKRAGAEQAILGQVGLPLIDEVNGLYDIYQDLLIEWLGQPWKWQGTRLERDINNDLYAVLDVELGPKPWFINLKMHYYKDHLGYEFHEPWRFRPNMKSVVGWCSWEAVRRDVSQEDVSSASAFFSKHLKEYGFEYIQIDDGFEKMPLPYDSKEPLSKGWLTTNEQFPLGHQGIVDEVNQHGLIPGIWTNANVTNEAFASNYAQHFLKGVDGELMLGEWIDYLLDCSEESLRIHVKPYYEGLKDYGYQYFKTDAIRHLLFDGLHEAVRQGLLTNDDAKKKFRAFMCSARDGIGDENYLLASWGVMSEVIGLVDSCRIAMDANPTWAGVRMQLFESARWFHSQRILFLNDPDHICARAKLEWTRSLTSLVSLTGSLFMLSDPLTEYDSDRIDIFKKSLPTLETITAETGQLDMEYAAFTWTKLHGFAVPRENPVEAEEISEFDAWNMAGESPTIGSNNPFSSLWAIHMDKHFRRWCVVMRVATVPLDQTVLKLEQLNLQKDKVYHVIDYWNQEYIGLTHQSIKVKALELGDCQILGIVPYQITPHFIASFRHVSMGGISFLEESYKDKIYALKLEGIVGSHERIMISVPKGIVIDTMTASSEKAVFKQTGELLTLELSFEHSIETVTLQCLE